MSDESIFLQRVIIDANRKSDEEMEPYSRKADEKMDKFDRKMENYSKKTDDKMDTFLQKITDSVGTQVHGLNSTVAKMKEEGDRCKQISERMANMERKILDIDEKCDNRSGRTQRSTWRHESR